MEQKTETKVPDFFLSKDECVKAEKIKVQTNPRYRDYVQKHFTAGDIDQFEQHRDPTNGNFCETRPSLESNIFLHTNPPLPVSWEKYRDLSVPDINNTFLYLFEKFKKGIFLKIKNGKVSVFLPFSKKNFFNEWGNRIKVDPNGVDRGDFLSFIERITVKSGYYFNPKKVNTDPYTYYANNCLFRYEFPLSEGDTNVSQVSDMLEELAKTRNIPDVEVFLNRRDFPVLKKDGTEPYNHIFDSENFPLISHNYPKYTPILSMVSSDLYADIPIPTGDDWSRVARLDGKFFPKTCTREFTMKTDLKWDQKKPIAVFRGGTTGCGTTTETNPRLHAVKISKTTPKDTDGLFLLDAEITDWNLRPRKLQEDPYIKTIEPENLPFDLGKKLTPSQQAEYKYILHISGHVSAFRLSLELEAGSCILLVESKYKLWFQCITDEKGQPIFKENKHYISIKPNMSDLIPKIRWCKKNDLKVKTIAENAQKFAKKYLTKKGILDYLEKLFWDIKKTTGTYIYNVVSLRELQLNQERIMVENKNCIVQGSDRRIFFHNEKTTISLIKLNERWIMEKKCDNAIHDAFIGTELNRLRRYIPNFPYTYGYSDGKIYGEFVRCTSNQGSRQITLYEYLNSDKEFVLAEFVSILYQISLALQMGQDLFGFQHNDLTPWNIVLTRYPQDQDIFYILGRSSSSLGRSLTSHTVKKITTKIVPIIIDYGRSHIVKNNCHYGRLTNNFQDILSILVVSISELSKYNLNKLEVVVLMTLGNYIIGTGFRKEPFSSFTELGRFCDRYRKYSDLLFSEKHELATRSPNDFIDFLEKNTRTLPLFRFENVDSVPNHYFSFKEELVCNDLGLRNGPISRRRPSEDLKKYVEKIEQLTIPKSQFFQTYLYLTLKESIEDVYSNISKKKYRDLYNRTSFLLEKLKPRSSFLEDLEPLEETIPTLVRGVFETPLGTVFDRPELVLENMKKTEFVSTDFSLQKEMMYILASSMFSSEAREFYRKRYRKVIELDLNVLATGNSLFVFGPKVYRKNLEYLRLRNNLRSCDSVPKIEKTYREVIRRSA